jgi:predicted CXXCH cytochrome family protein
MDDPFASMDPKKGFVGAPKTRDVPKFCGKCHSDVEFMRKYNPKLRVDQYQLYLTSNHGKLLAKGDTNVATCISCHDSHGILAVSDHSSPVFDVNVPATCAGCHANAKYMKQYEIPTDQFEQYSASIHGNMLLKNQDRSAPACNDCHGNHGATPPGLGDIASACGECHANNRDLFNESPHKQVFNEVGLPECATCHGYHLVTKTSDEMLGVGDNSVCVQCHTDPDMEPYQVALKIKAAVDSLKASINKADLLVGKAERAGVDVAKARFELGLAGDEIIKARNLTHSVSLEKVTEVTKAGINQSSVVQESGKRALANLRIRRIGLGVSSLIILLFAMGLYLKIKQFNGNAQQQRGID